MNLSFRFAAALFFVSGATSLVNQVVWLKYLSYVFGNTTQAAAILLAVFMGGLGLGAWLWGRSAWARRADPVLVYGLFEGGIGLLGAISPLFFVAMDAAYVGLFRAAGDSPGLFTAARAALAAVFLLPPTILMGGTLPLLARGFEEEGGRRGRATGLLYSWNTAGAVAGTLAATYVLVPAFGLRTTLGISAAGNAVILVAVLVARRGAGALAAPGAPTPAPPPPRLWLLLMAAIGFASLGYEVVWTRVLVFFFGSSVYAFGTMLATILFGLAAGAAAVSPILPRLRRPALALALLEAGVAIGVTLQIALVPGLSDRMVRFAALWNHVDAGTHAMTLLLSAASVLLLPTLFMGAAFPVAVRVAAPTGEAGLGVGRVYAANTFGAIAGSLACGFLLVPRFGTQNALLLLAALNVVCAAAAAGAAGTRRRVGAAALAAAALVGVALLARALPPNLLIRSSGLVGAAGTRLLEFTEDASCAVTVQQYPGVDGPGTGARAIEVNGVNVAGSTPSLVAIQKLQGHLPLLVHGQARSVLHIGFGSGGTAFAVSRHPVTDLRVAEISPAVLRASDRHFREINGGVLADPRTRAVIVDGRNFVLASPETFDVILSDSIHPRYAGNGSLYTEDYFRLCRERLAPGGVISMWLPIYSLTERNLRQIVRAFADVFPATAVFYPSKVLNPFLIVLARADDRPFDLDRVRAAWARPGIADELRGVGYASPEDLLADVLLAGPPLRDWVRDVPPHVDDRPAVEYESGRVLSREGAWAIGFRSVLAAARGPAPILTATSPEGWAAAKETLRLAAERAATVLPRHRADLDRLVGGPPSAVPETLPR